jgi:hypothetical protein
LRTYISVVDEDDVSCSGEDQSHHHNAKPIVSRVVHVGW